MFKAYYNLLLPESNNVENSSYTDSTLLSSTDLSSFALAYDTVVVVCCYAPTTPFIIEKNRTVEIFLFSTYYLFDLGFGVFGLSLGGFLLRSDIGQD